MSFDKLMEEAWAIRHTAIRKVVERGERHPEYARAGIEGFYDEVPGLFKPFSQMPDPAGYRPVIEDLAAVLQKLSSGHLNHNPINSGEHFYANANLSRITTASSYLTEWDGQAASAFKRNFLDPFPHICRNQFILTAVCKGALEAHQAMWDNARKNTDQIVHATLDALEKRDRCDKNEWTITFTILAGVATIGAVPLAPVSMAAATAVTAVGAAAQVAAASPPDEQPVTYHGETVYQIIAEMRRAVDKVAHDIQHTEETIFKALDATNHTVNGQKALFVSPRPALADAHPGNIRDLLGNPE